jgi:ectoine hydroxylase-related dioxygenase (phytanoyl-CoA dioxygenase family)
LNIYVDQSEGVEAAASVYEQAGVVVVRNLLEPATVARMQTITLECVKRFALTQNIDLSGHRDLDEAFNALCSHDRRLGGAIYDMGKKHPMVVETLTHPRLLEYVAQFLRAECVYYAIDQIHFRIERKGEDRFALDWHQDVWYTNTTEHAITAWYALTDVPLELGPMRLILGSHRKMEMVDVDPEINTKFDNSQAFTLVSPVEESAAIDVHVNAGDVVLLHQVALHRSGRNVSDKNRWGIVTRYTDLFADEFVRKGWKCGIQRGRPTFLDTHPHAIRNHSAIAGK